MKRTQIYLPEEIAEDLQALAGAEGRSAAAIVREAVQEYITKKKPDPARNPLLRMIGLGSGGPPDAAENHDFYLYSGYDDDK